MECFVCTENLVDDANKCWLVERHRGAHTPVDDQLLVSPDAVHRACAVNMLDHRGPLGGDVMGFKVGQAKPAAGGLILRR
ncbi:MAG TPA: hypothetical protein VNZ86_15800 [Bacteroidia bacterium]|jgi:hypothetical protein|nr:hypothetical protein [Bacteroidia bacterium]